MFVVEIATHHEETRPIVPGEIHGGAINWAEKPAIVPSSSAHFVQHFVLGYHRTQTKRGLDPSAGQGGILASARGIGERIAPRSSERANIARGYQTMRELLTEHSSVAANVGHHRAQAAAHRFE